MTRDEYIKALAKAERAYRTAAVRAEDKRADRHRLIIDAAAAGLQHVEIARATGLTRGRVAQILTGPKT